VGTVSGLPQAWAALIALADQKPSWRWMKHLKLAKHDDLLAVLSPSEELNAEQVRFLLSRRGQLAEELSKLTGRTIRIELQIAGQTQDGSGAPGSAPMPQRGNVPVSLQDAMTLPLVRQVMDHFNASIMEVRRDDANSPKIAPAALPDPDADVTMMDIGPEDMGLEMDNE
jgi:hypothetical protein